MWQLGCHHCSANIYMYLLPTYTSWEIGPSNLVHPFFLIYIQKMTPVQFCKRYLLRLYTLSTLYKKQLRLNNFRSGQFKKVYKKNLLICSHREFHSIVSYYVPAMTSIPACLHTFIKIDLLPRIQEGLRHYVH